MNNKELTKIKQNKLSHERLLELLEYNPDTGDFINKKQRNSTLSGKMAGTQNIRGYRIITLDWIPYLSHRLAWFYYHNKWPKDQIDHINRNNGDNRISNLREATPSINMLNVENKAEKRSGVEGIYWCNRYNFWKVNYKGKFLCNSDTIEEGVKNQQQASNGSFIKPPRRGAASKQSGIPGVRWEKNRAHWQVIIGKKYIGRGETIEEAVYIKQEYEDTKAARKKSIALGLL